jgi:flagellar biosynthesis component FlhA
MSQHINQAQMSTRSVGFIESLYNSVFIPGNLPSQLFLLINGSLFLLVVIAFVLMTMGYAKSIHLWVLLLLAAALFITVQWVTHLLPKDLSLNNVQTASARRTKTNNKKIKTNKFKKHSSE